VASVDRILLRVFLTAGQVFGEGMRWHCRMVNASSCDGLTTTRENEARPSPGHAAKSGDAKLRHGDGAKVGRACCAGVITSIVSPSIRALSASGLPVLLENDSQELIAFADSSPASRAPGFVDVVEPNRLLESELTLNPTSLGRRMPRPGR
jgi:hypothetical protein